MIRKFSELRDRLIILVMTGTSASTQLITIGVDIGSKMQLFFGEQSINLLRAANLTNCTFSYEGMKE